LDVVALSFAAEFVETSLPRAFADEVNWAVLFSHHSRNSTDGHTLYHEVGHMLALEHDPTVLRRHPPSVDQRPGMGYRAEAFSGGSSAVPSDERQPWGLPLYGSLMNYGVDHSGVPGLQAYSEGGRGAAGEFALGAESKLGEPSSNGMVLSTAVGDPEWTVSAVDGRCPPGYAAPEVSSQTFQHTASADFPGWSARSCYRLETGFDLDGDGFVTAVPLVTEDPDGTQRVGSWDLNGSCEYMPQSRRWRLRHAGSCESGEPPLNDYVTTGPEIVVPFEFCGEPHDHIFAPEECVEDADCADAEYCLKADPPSALRGLIPAPAGRCMRRHETGGERGLFVAANTDWRIEIDLATTEPEGAYVCVHVADASGVLLGGVWMLKYLLDADPPLDVRDTETMEFPLIDGDLCGLVRCGE